MTWLDIWHAYLTFGVPFCLTTVAVTALAAGMQRSRLAYYDAMAAYWHYRGDWSKGHRYRMRALRYIIATN